MNTTLPEHNTKLTFEYKLTSTLIKSDLKKEELLQQHYRSGINAMRDQVQIEDYNSYGLLL